jgi:hypothetical protein
MNERIKKLIAQADKLSLQYANKNNINFVDAFNIVFAELMVEEFQTILRNNRGQDTGTLSYRVEEHFRS